MEGVDKLPEGNIACEFESNALSLRVNQTGEKDRVLLVRPLFDEIDPDKSSCNVKR